MRDDRIDFGFRFAEYAYRIASRLERTLRGLLIGDSLLQILLRHALDLVEPPRALQHMRRQIQKSRRRDQIGVRLNEIRGLDRDQRLALFHLIADLGISPD